jgi:RNA polymerase sigma factor (sigma-70 family)
MNTPENSPDLLTQLRSGSDSAFELVYRKHFRAATHFVRHNSGTEQDARDVFQEAMLVLVKKSRDENFRLTANVGTFLYAVVQRQWLHRLRTKRNRPEVLTADPNANRLENADDQTDIEATENTFETKHETVKNLLDTLKTECQQLILYTFYQKLPNGEIARLLGYAESFVKVKRHRCMEMLREKVKNHPIFRNEG